jgi:MFS family permease
MQRLFALIAAVVLVDMMFFAAITPLLPQYVDELGLSKSAAGVLSASYAAGALIAALPSGWLAAQLGARQTLLAGLALLSISSVAFAFADRIEVLDAARFAQGVGGACAWTGGLAWLISAAPPERRGGMIGAAIAAAIIGVLLGPVLGGAATVAGPEPVFSAVGILSAALAVWAWLTPGVPRLSTPHLRRVAGVLISAPVLAGIWLVALPALLSGVLNVLAPLRLAELGASGVAIGAIFLLAGAFEAIASRAFGRLSDRHGRMVLIRAGLVGCAVIAVLLPLPATILPLAMVVATAVVCLALLWAPTMALLSDTAEARGLDLAFAFAVANLAWAGGQVVGGSGGAWLAEATSRQIPYSVVAVLCAATFAMYLVGRSWAGRPRSQ